MKSVIIGAAVTLLAGLVAAYFFYSPNGYKTNPPSGQPQDQIVVEEQMAIDSRQTIGKPEIAVNKRAAFAIFTNGTFRIFSAPMYHNLSEDIYIESSNPNIIKIQKSNLTWDDFFRTLPLKLDHNCLTTGTGQTFCSGEKGTLKFYINGEDSSGDALLKVINNGDRLLVSFGSETQEQIKSQIEKIPNPL